MFGNRFLKNWFSLLLAIPLFASAAPPATDDEKDIAITSHAFEYNHKTGIATYTGKVFAEQGSRKLWGDKLQIIRTADGDIDKIIVTGLPAKLEQAGDIYEAPLIEYDPSKETVRSPQNGQGQTTIILKPRARS
jgi:lipopolysaccharide export system protein LptA